ncbi:ABC transporter permease [Microbacterium fluvii]|uniref:ABC transporter permease n=1 Tax=Microbacterium fluvii TaxID=415215 RepID=A0ABW2HEQ3_9MICO|nr:ABC transporter permease [Microbacterium fluvii]
MFRVPDPSAPAWAILRGAVQLAAISFVLSGIISNPFWIAAALAVMFVVASTVAAHRVGWSWTVLAQTGLAILAGAATTMLVVFGTGALELTARFALAIGAIIIGNAMSVATLTGRNFTTAVVDHWDEVEGWLAVGATPRQSTVHLARRAIRDALVPSIDQTKTTGLVVLPGAFVGAIFGGLSPLEAGRFQIVVLAGILATGTSPHR